MLGFAKFESASRFCTAFDELRNYLRVQTTGSEHVPADVRRKIFTERWSTLMTELSAQLQRLIMYLGRPEFMVGAEF